MENIRIGDKVRVKNDGYTHGLLEGREGVVMDIQYNVILPVSVALAMEDGVIDPDVPFDFSELEVIEE